MLVYSMPIIIGIVCSDGGTYRVGIIATIDEDCASLQLLEKLFTSNKILGPYTRSQAVITSIHPLDGLIIGLYLHDGNYWAKCLFLHDNHVMIHIGENSWNDVVAIGRRVCEARVFWCDVQSTLGQGILDL